MAVLCVLVCASPLLMSSVVFSGLSKPLDLFHLEYQDGLGAPSEIIIHTFIRLIAISSFPIILLTSITYLMAVRTHSVEDLAVSLLLTMHLNQSWLAIFITTVIATPRYAHRVCPLLAAISGFTSGYLVPANKMPTFFSWIFYINPTFWTYAGLSKQILADKQLPCSLEARDSGIECYTQTGPFLYNRSLR